MMEGALIEKLGASEATVDSLERHQLELEKANEELEELAALRENLLNAMSHALRTPLVSILAYADIWKGRYCPRDEREEEIIQEVSASSLAMLETVNNVLEWSRHETLAQVLNYEPVEVVDLIQSVFSRIKSLSDQKNINLGYDIDGDVPIFDADSFRLGIVINNLLTNSIKNTDSGGHVRVRVSCDEENRMIRFEVSDTGRGISEDGLSKIFDRFVQVDGGSLSVSGDGSGFGLAVVKRLVDMHSGRITVESQIGKGSTFTVYIPAKAGSRKELE